MTCLAERRASSACGTSAESKHPEDVFLTSLLQGVLSKLNGLERSEEAAWVEFPGRGMAEVVFSGSFDSSPVASSLGLAQEYRDKNLLSN